MARGWESKSVEAQQEAAVGAASSGKPRLTRQQADRLREKESLRLSMKRLIEQLDHAQNSRHRQMLENAKLALEERITSLNS
jgi:soluble cytochrome b562